MPDSSACFDHGQADPILDRTSWVLFSSLTKSSQGPVSKAAQGNKRCVADEADTPGRVLSAHEAALAAERDVRDLPINPLHVLIQPTAEPDRQKCPVRAGGRNRSVGHEPGCSARDSTRQDSRPSKDP